MKKLRLKKNVKKALANMLIIINVLMFVKCGFIKTDYIKGLLFLINALYINYKIEK